MGTEKIEKEMKSFTASVQQLSSGISKASSLWRDEKFAELSASVGEIANQSRDVMVAGDRCCESISRFDRIAEENY